MSKQAKIANRKRRDGTIEVCEPNASAASDVVEQYGHLGLGDSEFPISLPTLKNIHACKNFLNRAHAAWLQMHRNVINDQTLPPAPKQRQAASSSASRRLVLGLLYNVLRVMRSESKQRNKVGIQKNSRHPVLLLKGHNGIVLGWCLARAFYRPLRLWGVRIRSLQESDLEVLPCILSLDICRNNFPNIDDMDVIADSLKDGNNQIESFSYALPEYKFDWHTPMSELHVTRQFDWVTWSQSDVESEWEGSSNGDDDDKGDDEDDNAADKEAEDALDLLHSVTASGNCAEHNNATCSFVLYIVLYNLYRSNLTII